MDNQEVIVTLALEGWIEEFFLPEYLKLLESKSNINFTRDNIANPSYGKTVGKDKNLSRLLRVAEAAQQNALNHKKRILLIFGVDCEWENAGKPIVTKAEIDSEIDRITRIFHESTPGLAKDQKVLFIPIRSFDTRIWYLRNPKAQPGRFEGLPSKDLKKEIYPFGKSSREHSINVVEKLISDQLLQPERLNLLTTQSPSFAHFHQQIITYLQNIS